MLSESEKFLVRGNPIQRVLAGAIRAYFDAGGKDIPFSALEHTLDLAKATQEYKDNLTSPELLTQFMCSFWAEAGQKIGKSIVVDKFPLTAKEIKEKAKKGQMAIFIPEGVTKEDLGKMFSKMNSWAVKEGNSAVDIVDNSGWLWIEASVDAPNRKTTQEQLEEKFKKERKQGQPLRSYIVGSQISKLLTGEYFDEGSAWSRLLGCRDEDGVLHAYFHSDGYLDVLSRLNPEARRGRLGGRGQEAIKP